MDIAGKTVRTLSISVRQAIRGAGLAVTSVAVALVAAISDVRAVTVEEFPSTSISVTSSPDRIQWGDEIDIVVTATNPTGRTAQGGVYISFDQDVLVIEVSGGKVLAPGSPSLALSDFKPRITRGLLIEGWEEKWDAGIERRVTAKVLPLKGKRLRVLARMTLIETSGGQPRLSIAPRRFDTNASDELGFPVMAAYTWIIQRSSIRRAVRRFERRVRSLELASQRKFADAFAAVLEDPKGFSQLVPGDAGKDVSEAASSFGKQAPQIARKLRDDPVVALDMLRCIMASLNCRDALVYFGVPLAFFEEASAEDAARQALEKPFEGEPGGQEFLLLLEAASLPLRRETTGEFVVTVGDKTLKAGPSAPYTVPLLDQVIVALGDKAGHEQGSVNGLSFKSLREQIK